MATYKSSGVTIFRFISMLFASTLLASCATKPWTDPLQEKEADSVMQAVDTMISSEATCGNTLEGDLMLFFETPFDKKSVSGFLQFSVPSAYKFIVTNPLGQPMLAVAGNRDSFQAINTLQQKYLAGSVRSFGLRSDIPSFMLKGDWGGWLTGRNMQGSQKILAIRYDRESDGVWLTFPNIGQKGVYHLLLDRDKRLFSTRIQEDDRGRSVAKISYDNWTTVADCRQPLAINITGLDYGTNVQLILSNVSLSKEKKTFHFDPPKGYLRQYLP